MSAPSGSGPQPLSADRLTEVEGRAAHLYEFGADADVEEWNRLAGADVPALAAEVRRLWAERHVTNEALSDAAERMRADRDRIAELGAQREALAERLRAGQQWQRGRTPELVSENLVSQSELRSIFGIPLAPPWGDGITRTFAPTQALQLEDPHDSPLHRRYEKCRDFPGLGGPR